MLRNAWSNLGLTFLAFAALSPAYGCHVLRDSARSDGIRQLWHSWESSAALFAGSGHGRDLRAELADLLASLSLEGLYQRRYASAGLSSGATDSMVNDLK